MSVFRLPGKEETCHFLVSDQFGLVSELGVRLRCFPDPGIRALTAQVGGRGPVGLRG